MHQTIFNKGHTLYRAGEKADRVYVLLNGEVGLFSPLDPNDTVLRCDNYGTFGEEEVIDGQFRRFTARCLEDCEVLEISKQDFIARLDGSDPLIKLLIKSLHRNRVAKSPMDAHRVSHAA